MPKIDIFVFFKALEYPKSCEVYRTKNSLFVLKLQLLELGMVQVPLSKSTMSSWNSCVYFIHSPLFSGDICFGAPATDNKYSFHSEKLKTEGQQWTYQTFSDQPLLV